MGKNSIFEGLSRKKACSREMRVVLSRAWETGDLTEQNRRFGILILTVYSLAGKEHDLVYTLKTILTTELQIEEGTETR